MTFWSYVWDVPDVKICVFLAFVFLIRLSCVSRVSDFAGTPVVYFWWNECKTWICIPPLDVNDNSRHRRDGRQRQRPRVWPRRPHELHCPRRGGPSVCGTSQSKLYAWGGAVSFHFFGYFVGFPAAIGLTPHFVFAAWNRTWTASWIITRTLLWVL